MNDKIVVACPHCRNVPCLLLDVSEQSRVKNYSDSDVLVRIPKVESQVLDENTKQKV